MTASWITIIWSAIATATLGLAALHLLIWLNNRANWANLSISLAAAAAAGMAVIEFQMMHAETPGQWGTAVRWLHVPAWVMFLSLTVFTLLYLRAGRRWLAWSVCAVRTFALLINFLLDPNISFREITALRHVRFLGESISVAEGVANPWVFVAQFGLLLFLAFVVDAAITVWRRGERRLALVTGGSIVIFVLCSTVLALFTIHGRVDLPFTASFFFMAVVLTMTYEMSRDVLQAAQLGTQLKTSQTELRISENRLLQVTNAAAVGLWEWNVERDEMWASTQGLALFGIAAEERLDLNRILTAIHPEDQDTIRNAITRSLNEGGSYIREYRVVMPGGKVRWIQSRGRVEVDATTKVVLLRGLSIDVTERNGAQARFQRVVEAAPNGIIMVNPDGRITLVNTAAETIFGYSRQELIGQSIEKLIPERFRTGQAFDDGAYFDSPVSRMMAGREAFGRRKDGIEMPLEIGLNPISSPNGLVSEVLATIVDVSERRKNIEALIQEQAFLRQVIDIVPNLIFAKNREGQFTLVNQAVADIYGTTVNELIGRTDADFDKSAEEVEAFRRADLHVMDTLQEKFIPEERITDAHGEVHWLQTVKRPLRAADGTVTQILGSSTDITVRKQTEFELERQRNELAHFSRVTMLSELSGSLAHELNQPLAAILSNAQAALRFLAAEQQNIEEVREILRDIVNDDKRAGEVIKGMRLLLKKGERRQEPLDVNDVTRNVLRLMNSDILNAGVSLTTRFAPALPQIIGDPVQLQQVLINLVVNACDAMVDIAAAARELVVSTELDNDASIRICVVDHGKGIQAENLEQVFEPFYTTKVHGLGMGLAVCRQIVAAHGGRLWCENNAGRGTTFCCTIPTQSMDMT